jgi:hypothetical protein
MITSAPLASAAAGAGIGVLVLIVIVIGIGAYFVPTIIALIRKVPNTGSVVAINLLLGWSLIGWAVALAMALRDQRAPTVVINQGVAPGIGAVQQPMHQAQPAAPPGTVPLQAPGQDRT